jgi:hypothetical protein
VKARRKLGCWRQSQGTSGGPESCVPSVSEGRGRWDLPAEGASNLRRVWSWWTARDKGSGSLEPNLGCQGRNERATGGACKSARRARVRLRTPARANSSGHRATLRGGEAGSGWRRSTNCVTTQGRRCRQRLFGAVVDGNAWNLGRWLGRKRGAGRGGRKGESLKLGNGVFQRIRVTTSRLQRLGRDIFSRNNGGASAASGRRE